jgi:hypothetical protein
MAVAVCINSTGLNTAYGTTIATLDLRTTKIGKTSMNQLLEGWQTRMKVDLNTPIRISHKVKNGNQGFKAGLGFVYGNAILCYECYVSVHSIIKDLIDITNGGHSSNYPRVDHDNTCINLAYITNCFICHERVHTP